MRHRDFSSADETWEAATARVVDGPLAALAHPVRRYLLELLIYGDEQAGSLAGSAAAAFGISTSRASQHLQVLARAELVDVIPDGPIRNYRLNDTGLAEITEWIASLNPLRATGR